MVREHHRLNGHEFEQTLGDSEGQGSLVCCSPWIHKELDTTERLKYCIAISALQIAGGSHHVPTGQCCCIRL